MNNYTVLPAMPIPPATTTSGGDWRYLSDLKPMTFDVASASVLPSRTLGVDVWEGSLEIDEQILWDAGVRFMMIRLNSITGGLHKDDNFDNQWKQAERFVRCPYFVYNPFVKGAENFSWLTYHLPAFQNHIAIDVEVRRTEYDAAVYGAELAVFLGKVKAIGLVPIIYTGQWFLQYLTPWPKNVDYWWARYPASLYPDVATPISWEELKAKVYAAGWQVPATPGPCWLWQCSGDRFKPPGCAARAIDINLFNGDENLLRSYFDQQPQPPTLEDRVAALESDMAMVKGKLNL